jgi:hypothetical protein
MSSFAVKSRVFQFEAGPERHRFYACAEHAPKLEKAPDCFLMFVRPEAQDTQAHTEDDDFSCWFCQEG